MQNQDALRHICYASDVVWIDGEAYLVTPVSTDLLDDLAAFEADAAELEDTDLEDTCEDEGAQCDDEGVVDWPARALR